MTTTSPATPLPQEVNILPSGTLSNPPSEQFRAVQIGVGNRGASNLSGLLEAGAKVIAVADVNAHYAGLGARKCGEGTRIYSDYRVMIDQLHREFDGILVSTPDHTHAEPSLMAMALGKHCYCEKPLAHNIWEVRKMVESARENKVITQMGTQIHASENYRRVVERIQAGAIGEVKEFHIWCGKGWNRTGARPTDTPPVPAELDWDLWLGPAEERPYHREYCPADWRRWWEYGSGTFGDMACHVTDLAFWALDLQSPTSCEAVGSEVSLMNCPTWVKAEYQYPARGAGLPACTGFWVDGDAVEKHLDFLCNEKGLPTECRGGLGVYFIGEKGTLFADYRRCLLLPEEKFENYVFTGTPIPSSPGHYKEWITAVKSGNPADALCNFDYAGALSETVLLGTVAYRLQKKIEWDSANLQAKGMPEADQFIRRSYRPGWELP